MSRWISVPRPSFSRRLRGVVLPGSIAYSAVTQPEGFSWRIFQGGMVSSTLAVQRIVVRPAAMRTLPAADFTVLAATHGFDDAWIAEQARRGFIARKPGADGGPETITVTSKARTRYGV